MHRRAAAVALLTWSVGPLSGHEVGPAEEFTLPNGIRLIVQQDPAAGAVGVLAIYDTGFVDDPAGLPQASHLAEHLRCTAATASHEAGVSFAELNAIGQASAETLLNSTYYDAIVAPEQLGIVLGIEAERLSSLRVEAPDISREAPRAVAEIDTLLALRSKHLGKFAQMAAVQAWFHGTQQIRLRLGLDSAEPTVLADLVREHHSPGSLTIMIVGAVDAESARQTAVDQLAHIPRTDNPEPVRPDLSKSPAHAVWDLPARAVAVALPDPEDPLKRCALTLLGVHLTAAARNTDGVTSAIGSGPTSPIGPMPFHVIVILSDDADAAAVGHALSAMIDGAAGRAEMVRRMAQQFAGESDAIEPQLIQRYTTMMSARGVEPATAHTMLLTNAALQRMLRDRALSPVHLAELAAMNEEQFTRLLVETLEASPRTVTFFESDGL